MTKKEKLQKAIDTARTELWAIEEKEAEERNRDLIGKCFKYQNCYSCPQGPEDYWWMYARVLSVDGRSVRMWQFQTDKYGKVEVEPDTRCGQMTSGYQEIPSAEFDAAWRELMEKLERL